MKTLIKTFLFIFLLSFLANYSYSQQKPEPIKSALLEKFMGNWASEPYEMMGGTWTDEANHYMNHNGQFMFIDIKGKNTAGETYTGTIVMKPEQDGTIKGWAFDDWGSVSTYTGKVLADNKLTVTGTSSWGTETREIEINGNKMVHNLTMTMKGKDGKEMTMKMVINYNKK
jgi:hypothetical protein